MKRITRWLITRRDRAAETWLHKLHTQQPSRRAHARLTLWDALLGAWTKNGTRRA